MAKKATIQLAWGIASPKRGLTYAQHAIDFAAQYPINSLLSIQEFSDWLLAQQLIIPPQKHTPHSYERYGFIHKLRAIRKSLNRAASHPRMHDTPYPPYIIRSKDRKTEYEVQAITEAIKQREEPKIIYTFVKTKQQNVQELMQGEDWSQIEPWDRVIAEQSFEDILKIATDVQRLTQEVQERHAKLLQRIQEEKLRLSQGKQRPKAANG